jgi:hypothetical protein
MSPVILSELQKDSSLRKVDFSASSKCLRIRAQYEGNKIICRLFFLGGGGVDSADGCQGYFSPEPKFINIVSSLERYIFNLKDIFPPEAVCWLFLFIKLQAVFLEIRVAAQAQRKEIGL